MGAAVASRSSTCAGLPLEYSDADIALHYPRAPWARMTAVVAARTLGTFCTFLSPPIRRLLQSTRPLKTCATAGPARDRTCVMGGLFALAGVAGTSHVPGATRSSARSCCRRRSEVASSSSPSSTSRMSCTRRAASPSEKHIGGLNLRTLWKGPSVESSTPRACMRCTSQWACAGAGLLEPASRTSSTPRNSPRPRTSPMSGHDSASPQSSRLSMAPVSAARASSPSSRSTRSTASPAAHAALEPPKVLKYSMPESKASATARVTATMPTG
mmetsp:Transcript_65968/g.208823  ORF Transcript_65968/g.208823 Transcript_65968/m.208823 type:complete len:271 (-) Transcript_65968:879-1691(-)